VPSLFSKGNLKVSHIRQFRLNRTNLWTTLYSAIFIVSLSVLDNPAKSLHPVLGDRKEFALPGVIENLSCRKNQAVSVRCGNWLQFLFQMTKDTKVTQPRAGAMGRMRHSDGDRCLVIFFRTLRIMG
jgi:hypothetical protein